MFSLLDVLEHGLRVFSASSEGLNLLKTQIHVSVLKAQCILKAQIHMSSRLKVHGVGSRHLQQEPVNMRDMSLL